MVLTNCSNHGPGNFQNDPCGHAESSSPRAPPLYGDGLNVRDWPYVEDHDALLLAACWELGRYCVGGHGEATNKQVVNRICASSTNSMPTARPTPN